ncbi:MAG: hypothetical protein O3C40_08890 [Planctomycetota bacterium]|nr:hypothetical protein [Planctomycetota bacterium]
MYTTYISEEEEIADVAFSPDGKSIAFATVQQVKVYEVASRRLLFSCEGHKGLVGDIAFSPDGKAIASVSVHDGSARLWEADSGTLIFSISLEHQGRIVAFVERGNTLAVGLHHMAIKLFAADTGQESGELGPGESNGRFFVSSLCASQDGRLLAAAGTDRSVHLWDVSKRSLVLTYDHSDEATAVALSADGKYLASGSADQKVIVRNTTTDRTLRVLLPSHHGGINSLAFSPDGTTLASSGHPFANIWEMRELPQEVVELEDEGSGYATLRFSPDGEEVAL